MGRLQRFLVNTVFGILLTTVLVAIFSNLTGTVSIRFLDWQIPDVPLGAGFAGITLLVAALSLIKLWDMTALYRRSVLKSERHLEKIEVSAEVSSDKVKALEAKIVTLEKALSKALEQASKSSKPSGNMVL